MNTGSPLPRTSLTPELQSWHGREKRAVGIGFMIMGLLVLLFGIWLAWDAVAFLAVARAIPGTCVGRAYHSSEHGKSNYLPIIEFRDGDQTHQFEARGILGLPYLSGHRKGHRVTVMVPNGRPADARVGGTWGQLQFPLVFLGAGLGLGLAGLRLTQFARRSEFG